MVVTMTIISTGPMTMPQAPNMAMPANTASSISAESRRACPRHQDRAQEVVDVRHHDEVEEDDEHTAENVAEQDHSDPERDRHDAAAERNHRQRGQQNREKEETLVETGDVDRGCARDTLTDGDDELPHDGALDHRAHLRHVEVGDLLAEGVELANDLQHACRGSSSSEMNTYRNRIAAVIAAEYAARRPLQEAQQPFADLLRDGGHRTPQRIRRDRDVDERHPVQHFVDEAQRLIAEGRQVGSSDPVGDSLDHVGDLDDREEHEQRQAARSPKRTPPAGSASPTVPVPNRLLSRLNSGVNR